MKALMIVVSLLVVGDVLLAAPGRVIAFCETVLH